MYLHLQFSLFRGLPFFLVDFCFFSTNEMDEDLVQTYYRMRKIRARSPTGSYSVLESTFSIVHFLAIPGKEIFAGMFEAWKGKYPLMPSQPQCQETLAASICR